MNNPVMAIPAFNDNYIWAILHANKKIAAIVDPGDAKPVMEYLDANNIKLAAILITHHHQDHIGGMLALAEKYNVPIYGPANDGITGLTHTLKDGDEVVLPELDVRYQVFDTPGHTKGHIVYYNDEAAFTGDTLFVAGCGRLFEGTAEQLYHSLQKLAALPDDTKVYCAHEYTLSNLRFARHIEPDNPDIEKHIAIARKCREENQPTVPSTIGIEKATNPFLRCLVSTIQNTAETVSNKQLNSPVDVFAEIRKMKDKF